MPDVSKCGYAREENLALRWGLMVNFKTWYAQICELKFLRTIIANWGNTNFENSTSI